MNQKPSERIEQIRQEIWKPYHNMGITPPDWCFQHALIQYLDEEWQKTQCDHSKDGVCNKCHG